MSELPPPDPSTFQDLAAPAVFSHELVSDIHNASRPLGGLAIDQLVSDAPVDLTDFLGGIAEDEYGYKRLQSEQLESFRGALEGLGVLAEKPTQEQTELGIAAAQLRVDSGEAVGHLAGIRFMNTTQLRALTNDGQAPRTLVSWDKQQPLYVDTEQVRGSSGIPSWQSSDNEPKSYRNRNGDLVESTSRRVILDYATRDTALSQYEANSLHLIITNEGPVLYSKGGSHRTAAAKLRNNEPLAFSSLLVVDARKQAASKIKE